jgi:hypothetical protein
LAFPSCAGGQWGVWELRSLPVIPSCVASSEPGVIHDVVDEEEIFIERFSSGNLLDDKIEAARASFASFALLLSLRITISF